MVETDTPRGAWWYVKRSKPEVRELTTGAKTPGRVSWTGPIRAKGQAEREALAWLSAGWAAEVVEATSEVRAVVREWTKQRNRERAAQGY